VEVGNAVFLGKINGFCYLGDVFDANEDVICQS